VPLSTHYSQRVTETTRGVRSVLARPAVYELWSRLVGAEHAWFTFIEDYVRPQPGDRILDLGCGPGQLLALLPKGVTYLGIDISPQYIARARQRFGAQARFEVGDATKFDAEASRFKLVLAYGVLHHLDDTQTLGLFESAARALESTGRLVTVDPVYAPDQSRAARAIISRDRGQHVRTRDEYARLARDRFSGVTDVVRHDFLRIPYSHCILECSAAGVKAA
jgi:SAM-dependent methyltransferase